MSILIQVVAHVHFGAVEQCLRKLVLGVDLERPDQGSNGFIENQLSDQLLGLIPLGSDSAADIPSVGVGLTDAVDAVHDDWLVGEMFKDP